MSKPNKKYDERAQGRFVASTGVEFVTDDEACSDGGDGPGFYLCSRVRCEAKRDALAIEARRALYVSARLARA
jgi:hypothetical protein